MGLYAQCDSPRPYHITTSHRDTALQNVFAEPRRDHLYSTILLAIQMDIAGSCPFSTVGVDHRDGLPSNIDPLNSLLWTNTRQGKGRA
jgi:hypothetical protein